ncbi:hypothetical protein TRFO_28019 [Tritrichomonas foetus]|uniref:VASt domain-containing protein n=1 Tax=Tritrichomonas foetus TaxID=1144522 RepID=A0A1J4K0L9_9EUKA|nr:hypothetical protein TRFO_28019 [Tritrichomonas foetus]|eukprot:OHT04506.1 hypothetical protein TRFO_28019 [Tritrichomonas foetus]
MKCNDVIKLANDENLFKLDHQFTDYFLISPFSFNIIFVTFSNDLTWLGHFHFEKKSWMREIYQFTHPNITATEYIKQHLRNSDVDRSLASSNGYDLKEWFYNRQDRCTIRYLINVKWTEPIEHIIGTSELTVNEKREFLLDSNPIQVKSTIRTNFHYISATVLHVFTNKGNGCVEDQTIEVVYSGGTLKDQIEHDFFAAIFPLFGSLQNNEANNKALAVPPQNFQAYHFMHDQLEHLKSSSQYFADVVERARIDRKPLILPSADQISRITEIVEPENFSIKNEVQQMRDEADRTLKIVGEIKRARQQTTGSSSLPAFILASCAAVIFLAVSRT